MEEFITYKTSSPAGDLISFLAGIKKIYETTGKKGLVYQRIGMPGLSYSGSIHPFLNERDEPVMMNQYMFDNLRPLLMSQEYIHDFVEHEGQEALFNFDLIRLERFCNQPKGSLNRWFFYIFPEMTCDLSQKWVLLPDEPNSEYKDFAVINFTQRHRNHLLNYHFLKQYEERVIFAGLKEERDLFCETWGLDVPHLQVEDFLQLAKIINGCKLLLGNASMCFQIAEATKCRRILETFPLMPNVIPIGEHAYDAYHQEPIELFVHQLMKN